MSARQAAASISVRSNVWRLGVTVNQCSLTPYTENIRQHQTHKQRTTIMSTEDKGRGKVTSLADWAVGVRPLSIRYSKRMCAVECDQVKFLLALLHYSRARDAPPAHRARYGGEPLL